MSTVNADQTEAAPVLDVGTVNAIVTERILAYHKKLVEDYDLKCVLTEQPLGVTADCTEDRS